VARENILVTTSSVSTLVMCVMDGQTVLMAQMKKQKNVVSFNFLTN
jgi:hypothetical protein